MARTKYQVSMGLFLLPSVLFAQAAPKFEPLSDENGIRIEVARNGPDPVPEIRATAQFPANSGKIAKVLTQFSRYGEIFSECWAKADVLEAGPAFARLHVVWRYPIIFRNRDSINRYDFTQHQGRYYLKWKSDARPNDPQEGVRLEYVRGSVEVRPLDDQKSEITYTFLGDLGGSFSLKAKETAWRTQPVHYFRGIATELGVSFPSTTAEKH